MASSNAFLEMLRQFLDELCETFPENETIKAAKQKTYTRSTIDRFMKYTTPRATLMTQRDPAFFSKKNKFADEIGLCDIWTSEDVSDQTRNAIWSYYSNLYMLAMTISMLPPEMLSMIEATAEKCAKNVQEGGQLDEKALMSSVSEIMNKMGPVPKNKSR